MILRMPNNVPKIDFFPDEKLAVASLKSKSTKANAEKLAAIRFKHAIDLYVYSKKNNDRDAFELALRYIESAVELDPFKAAYKFSLGKIYSEIEVEGAVLAIHPLKNAIELAPQVFEAEALLGTCYSRLGEHVNAVIHLEKAVAIDPKKLTRSLVQIMTYSYAKEPQLKRGIRFFSILNNEGKASPYAKVGLALLLRKDGEFERSQQILQEIFKNANASILDRKMAEYLMDLWKKGSK